MMKKRSLIATIFIFCIGIGVTNSPAQNSERQIQKLVESSRVVFSEFLKNNPRQLTSADWQFIVNKLERQVFLGNYEQAADLGIKATMLAENLDDKFLRAKSHRILGETETKLGQIKSAENNFRTAATMLTTVTDKVIIRESGLEFGRLVLDIAANQAKAEFINSPYKLDAALNNLSQVIALSERNSNDEEFRDLKIQAEMQAGEILGWRGHYIAKTILLENIDRVDLKRRKNYKLLFKIDFGLQSANRAIGNFAKATEAFAELKTLFDANLIGMDERFSYLRQLADFHTETLNKVERNENLDAGLQLARQSGNFIRLANFTSAKLLNSLEDENYSEAKKSLVQLQELAKNDKSFVNSMDLIVSEAVLTAIEGDVVKSAKLFKDADETLKNYQSESGNLFFLLYWKSKIALQKKRFDELEKVSEQYKNAALAVNHTDSLPFIYFNLAQMYYEQQKYRQASNANGEVLRLIEERRNSKTAQVSIGVVEILYRAYQLAADLEIKNENYIRAFQLSEQFKSRLLADKITDNAAKQSTLIATEDHLKVLNLALNLIRRPDDKLLLANLQEAEKNVVTLKKDVQVFNTEAASQNLSDELKSAPIDDHAALISYSFDSEDKLNVFVWTRSSPLAFTKLNLTKVEVEKIAAETADEIRNGIFFKQSGKKVYDLLLKPVESSVAMATHLIIVPDGALWKMPFQALSRDKEKYLIEEKTISYAPSIPILVAGLKKAPPTRRKAEVFANAVYKNVALKYVNQEAVQVSALLQTKPHLDADIDDFKAAAADADILHFSMHAQINRQKPFDSFLAFRNGELRVEDLLNLKVKKGSLVFLASCNTDNVYNSEGLVSLAWGMMAAGAGSVISAQWEADDEAATKFTQAFYKNLQREKNASKALQKTSIEAINNRVSGNNKPYYWAEFFLLGDYR